MTSGISNRPPTSASTFSRSSRRTLSPVVPCIPGKSTDQGSGFTLKIPREGRVLRNLLKWTSVLRLFCSGFRDKELDLKNYINHITVKNFSSKKEKGSPGSFSVPNETDCCICFSSYTNEINPVVYCSGYSPLKASLL